jgi:tetrahydromethanopterin S-methyltransferase subunit A
MSYLAKPSRHAVRASSADNTVISQTIHCISIGWKVSASHQLLSQGTMKAKVMGLVFICLFLFLTFLSLLLLWDKQILGE